MYTLPSSNYLRRSMMVDHGRTSPPAVTDPHSHEKRIKQELQALGVSRFGLWRLESRYLPHIIHSDERLEGVVYGRHEDGSVMLVATDRRVIFLDKKPLFIDKDEITYDVVSGVSYSSVGFGATVTLHTRVKDYSIRTFNQKTAEQFVHYIEYRCLEHKDKEERHDYTAKKWAI